MGFHCGLLLVLYLPGCSQLCVTAFQSGLKGDLSSSPVPSQITLAAKKTEALRALCSPPGAGVQVISNFLAKTTWALAVYQEEHC